MTQMPESTQPPSIQKAQALIAEVADTVRASAEDVRNRLGKMLVEREITSRVDLLDAAIQKRQTLIEALEKIDRADVETFSADGSLASSAYSKVRLSEIKKAREVLSKHEKAIELALAFNDFSRLKEADKP